MVAERKIDPALVVPSPITGLITARNAAPGLFVQPGNPPPVYIVADTSTMWMLANVPEKRRPELEGGPRGEGHVASLPGRVFQGKIVTIGAMVDPNTRRVLVRSEIANPRRRAEGRYVREFHDHVRAAEARARSAARRHRARGRRHDDRLGHAGPAQICQAHRQDRARPHDGFIEILEG